jgi:hypothetical protein
MMQKHEQSLTCNRVHESELVIAASDHTGKLWENLPSQRHAELLVGLWLKTGYSK